MNRFYNLLMSFLNKLFTFVNLQRVLSIFIIGIFFRFLSNTYSNINIIEYLISITFILSLCNNVFYYLIEYWLYLKVDNSKLILYINQPDKSNNYNSQYYNVEGYITISNPSELSNYDLDFNTRKSIRGQLFEEIAQPCKFREVIVPVNNGTGNVYLGIRYCDKPSNTQGLYVKYQNWFNQEYIWNIWEKDSSLKLSQVRSTINSRVHLWKEIRDTTGTDLAKEVRRLLDTDPFNINKSK